MGEFDDDHDDDGGDERERIHRVSRNSADEMSFRVCTSIDDEKMCEFDIDDALEANGT